LKVLVDSELLLVSAFCSGGKAANEDDGEEDGEKPAVTEPGGPAGYGLRVERRERGSDGT